MIQKTQKVILVRYHDKAGHNTRLPDSLNKVQGVLPPLGIAALAAALEQADIPVAIIDCPGSLISKERLEEILRDEKPDIVGIGPLMTPALEGIFEAVSICKRTGATTVVGGPHLAIYPKETLANKDIDFGIIGEGDFSLVKLVKEIRGQRNYREIPGLAWKENGKVCLSPATIVENLDELPMPAFHLLPMQNYNSIIGHHPVTTMMASRGCPYQCGFCYKTPSDKKTRYKDVNLVVKEMKSLVDKYGIREIMFYDDTLTIRRDYVLALCKEIKRQNVIVFWEAPTRVDHVDEELVKEMRSVGCIRLRLGVESGNEQIRKSMSKGITNSQVLNAFSWCKKYGIETFAYFIIGYVGEDEKTVNDTINFAIALDPDFAMFTMATPLPCTDLFDRAVKDGLIDKNYWLKYTLGDRSQRVPFMIANADKFIKKAYQKFYFRPEFILKKLWKLRNLDTLEKYLRAFRGLRNL